MKYSEILSMKDELRELRFQLDTLKGLDPTEENLAKVREIEKKARSITNCIRMRSNQCGIRA